MFTEEYINTHFDNTSPFEETAAPLFLERTATLSAVGVDKLIYGDLHRPPSDHFAVVAKIRLPAIKSE